MSKPPPDAHTAPLAYSIAEAARLSSISRETLYRHNRAGRLEFRKVGGRTLIPAASLERLINGEAA